MIVLGIDPSLTSTGLAVVDTEDRLVVDVQTVLSKGGKSDSIEQRLDRIRRIGAHVMTVGFRADLVVIEQPAYSRTAGHMHDRSGLWWFLVNATLGSQRIVVEVAPTTRARYATGKGNAGKDEVLLAVAKRYPHVDVTNNNEADALVLAAMGADHLGAPLVDLPQTHRAALDGVQWPTPGRAA